MTMKEGGTHILVFPYPAQGHMIPLLDLTHELATRGLTITILLTPKNLPLLNSLLAEHPSIQTLILPFPTHPCIPAAVENVKDLPAAGFRDMMHALSQLHDPILQWFQNHPSPPKAIISDMFLGWTHHLACRLNIPRFMFSPSGAMALSVIYSLWQHQPKLNNPNDHNSLIPFPKIPNSPVYPWWQLSPVYRSYIQGDPVSEFIKDGFLANIASWGLVINSFTELEGVYLDHLREVTGGDRVWAVGPLLPPKQTERERGGSSSVLAGEILSWLDKCEDQTVLYVCFGSQAVLRNKQMEEVALGLEKSGVRFVWSAKGPTKGHNEAQEYGVVPSGFEDRVGERGIVIRGWAPQVEILSHPALGLFLTHCGWNSVVESLVAGVPMLAWPMGADQFANATLLVDELKVAVKVCEGAETVPDSDELGRLVAEAMGSETRVKKKRERAMELRNAALRAVKNGGTSSTHLDGLVSHLSMPT